MRWLLGLAVLILFLGPASARAHVTNALSSLKVQADLRADGTVGITQELTYLQPSELTWALFTNNRDLQIEADGQRLDPAHWQATNANDQTAISSEVFASVWRLTYNTTTALVRRNNRDQLYLKVFQHTHQSIENIVVTFNLPDDVPNNALVGNVYSVSGSQNPQTTITSARSVRYSADAAGPEAVFTISANWPKGVLRLTKWEELRLNLLNLQSLPWIILGAILPLIALIVLSALLAWQKRNERPVTAVNSQPPSNLSPILVGVLVNKKVHPEEVVSLLVDLCQRGYLVIVKKNNQYYLSQRKIADEHLQDWEREIIDQLFPSPGAKISEASAKSLGDTALFSPQVRDAFNQIYEISTKLEFFAENPHATRVRYKLVALAFYFLALAGIIWTMVTDTSPYLLIPLIGTLVVSRLIIRISPKLIRYTPQGEAARQSWQAFGNYLGLPQPLGLESARNHAFEKYLAYSIALHQTTSWADRFERSSTVIIKPDWFISYQDTGTKELAEELVKFTQLVSVSLTKLRGPLVS